MPLVMPETFGDEIRELLLEVPALDRFTKAFSDNDTPEELVQDTHANVTKGEIWICHVDRTPEELGVTTGATAYTEIDEWQLVVIDGLSSTASQLAALQAVDQCLRGVLLPSATGRIEYTQGWKRITDRKADIVQAFVLSFTTNYDNLLDGIGHAGNVYLVSEGEDLIEI